MRVERSLSVVNFKRRIASFAWRASSSTFALRTYPSCIQHCLPLNAWRAMASRPTLPRAGVPALRVTLASYHLRHNTSRHNRLRPFHVAYGRSQKKSMAGSPMRGLINHALKAQVFAEGSASATTLACASLLANPYPPSPIT